MTEPNAARDPAESPCLRCSAPCCSALPLQSFRLASLVDLEYARLLAHFEDVELVLAADGEVRAYLRRACSQLSPEGRCRVFGRPERPRTCLAFDEQNCWYRHALSDDEAPDYLRLDLARVEALLRAMGLDPRGQLRVPPWEELLRRCRAVPLLASAAGPWTEEAPVGARSSGPEDPCGGCAAWCCTRLVFPEGLPRSRAALHFYDFALGFPGVSLALEPRGWSVVVSSRCRSLEADGRCASFGRRARPLFCARLQGQGCPQRALFESPARLVSPARWPELKARCHGDGEGRLLRVPTELPG